MNKILISYPFSLNPLFTWWDYGFSYNAPLWRNVNLSLSGVSLYLIFDNFNTRFFLQGKVSEAWTIITKSAIAENILHLTYLSEEQRIPSLCLGTSTLWLALASLCVLNEEHVEKLSSGSYYLIFLEIFQLELCLHQLTFLYRIESTL